MSDKKIAITIIILAFVTGIGYLLFGWGYVEIFVGNSGISRFELQTVEGKKLCENPCKVRLRPGKKLRGELSAKGFISEEVRMPKISIFAQQNVSLLLTPLINIKRIPIEVFVEMEEMRLQPFQKYEQDAIGPVRVNSAGSLAIFLRSAKGGKTELMLVNKAGKEQRLTVFKDTFMPSILEKNFQFFSHGILIPTTQKIYNYDFVTNDKSVLFEGKTFYIASISHKRNGDHVIKGKNGWKIVTSKGEEKKLEASVLWAQFSADDLWIVTKRQIKKNGFLVAEFPENVEEKDVIYFDFTDKKDTLWIRRDLEVWRVDL